MDEIINDGSPAESSSASTEQPSSQPAAQSQGSQQGQPAGTQQQEPPFHQHPRFRELTAQNRQMRDQLAVIMRERQQSQQQQGGQAQPMSPEEQQAIVALKRLIGNDPELKAILELAKKSPQMDQRFQSLDQFEARAAKAQMTAARSHIKELATQDGLPTDDASLRHIVRLVAGEAMAIDNGNERYNSGDMSLLDEAFNAIKPWLSAMRKPAEQSVAQTKTKTKQLPPPPRGGTAGEPAPKKLEQGKEREFEADMHKRAKERLSQLLQG